MEDVVQERIRYTPYTVLFLFPYNTCHILIYDVIYLFVGPITYYLCPWQEYKLHAAGSLCSARMYNPGCVNMPDTGHVLCHVTE